MEAVSSQMVACCKLLIVNGDSPPPKRSVDGVEKTYPPITTEEKLARKNELKARGNKESKKTQNTLLKQRYENFNGSSSQGLDQTYDRLQKLISQLEILGETISQKDMNLKFLRSLASEWKTHTLIWRNKADLDTLSMDDLYNNLKIYESKVKGSSSLKQNSQNVAFMSSNNAGSSNQAYGSNSVNTDMADGISDMRARRFLNNTEGRLMPMVPETIRAPRENRNREPVRRNVIVETTKTKALVAQDGLGYDWSDQAKEGPTNFALMAYTSSGSSSSDSEVLIKQLRDNALTELRKKFEKAKKERDDLKLTLEKFGNSSKNLSKLLEIQVKHATSHLPHWELHAPKPKYEYVPPPYTRNFMPPKSDLVYPSLDDFVDVNESVSESVVEKPTVETNEPKTARKENGAPIIEDWVSDSDEENVPKVKTVEMFNKPSFAKINFVKSTEQVKSPRKTSVDKNRQNTPSPRGNKRNWNQQMSQKLGSDFEMFNKACHVCGSFDHLKNDCNNWYGPISVNAVRPVNIVQSRTAVNNVGPVKNVINNAYSTTRMPYNKITAANNSNFTKKVNTVKGTRVNTARPKAVLSAVKGNKGNAVKASACWVWRPKHKVLDHGNPQQDLKDKGVIDSGCSRHMTGNKSYLTDYEEIDRGFVAFGGNSKGGKITGKGKIRTGKLDFEDVYFVKELKFNLFSVSQMCDKKNSVLFTDIECFVLSPDFKLTDDSHVLLKVPRKDNMYSVDLNNVVPQGGLTCLFAKATPDESNLWHRRLVRGLPSKFVKINQTCVAFQKGKQHKASYALRNSMNYKPVVTGNQSNGNTGIKAFDNAGKARVETVPGKDYILLPLWTQDLIFSSSLKDSPDAGFKPLGGGRKKRMLKIQRMKVEIQLKGNIVSTNNINTASDGNNTNNVNAVSSTVNAARIKVNVVDLKTSIELPNDPNMPELKDIV
ncbi:hypothetical protein Tco_0880995, partial [Tanacetum coccineum]